MKEATALSLRELSGAVPSTGLMAWSVLKLPQVGIRAGLGLEPTVAE